MVMWLIGIVEVLLGTAEQFLVNESRIVAGIIFNCRMYIVMWAEKKEI